MKLRTPGHATVVAYLALFVALASGGAWAASQIGNNRIKSNAIRSRHIKDGQVKSADVQDGGLTGADIQDGGLTGADVQDDSIGSAGITDGSLSTTDYALDTGTTSLDLPSIAGQTCGESGLIALSEGTFDNDPVVLSADDDFSGTPESKLVYETRLVGGAQNAFRIILCNITAAAYDPPAITFQWAILNRP